VAGDRTRRRNREGIPIRRKVEARKVDLVVLYFVRSTPGTSDKSGVTS